MDRTRVDPGDAPDSGRDTSGTTDRGDSDRRLYDTLNDLCAQALELDAKRERICDRVDEIAQSDADHRDLVELERRRIEVTAELKALRASIVALSRRADSPGRHL